MIQWGFAAGLGHPSIPRCREQGLGSARFTGPAGAVPSVVCGTREDKMQNCTIERLRFAHLHQEQPDADGHPLRAEVRKATKCSMRSVMKTGRLAAECT